MKEHEEYPRGRENDRFYVRRVDIPAHAGASRTRRSQEISSKRGGTKNARPMNYLIRRVVYNPALVRSAEQCGAIRQRGPEALKSACARGGGKRRRAARLLYYLLRKLPLSAQGTFSIYLDRLNEASIYPRHSDLDTANSLEVAGGVRGGGRREPSGRYSWGRKKERRARTERGRGPHGGDKGAKGGLKYQSAPLPGQRENVISPACAR